MYKQITFSDFQDAFKGDSSEFSYGALKALFDRYDEQDIELNTYDIGCQWCEYDEELIINDYAHLVDADDDDFEVVLEELQKQTTVITVKSNMFGKPSKTTYLVENF